jgi:hypothetical protein
MLWSLPLAPYTGQGIAVWHYYNWELLEKYRNVMKLNVLAYAGTRIVAK